MRIRLLADVPTAIAVLAPAFKAHWAADKPESHVQAIAQKFKECLNRDTLPLGLVATEGEDVLGSVALMTRSVHSRPSLGPWVAALYVFPTRRRQGIGAALVRAAEIEAKRLKRPVLYAGTESAVRLFTRLEWQAVETLEESGEHLTVLRKAVGT